MCCPDVRLQIGRPRVLLGTPFPSAWELRPVLIVESFVRFQSIRPNKCLVAFRAGQNINFVTSPMRYQRRPFGKCKRTAISITGVDGRVLFSVDSQLALKHKSFVATFILAEVRHDPRV